MVGPSRPQLPGARPLETERLLLEPLRVDHVDEMLSVLADRSLYAVTGGAPPDRDGLAERYRRWCDESTAPEGERWCNWVVRVRASGRAVGTVQATVTADAADLAWVVGVADQGRGYASEAARCVADWLRGQGRVLRAHIAPQHVASQRVALAVGLARSGRTDEDGEELWVCDLASRRPATTGDATGRASATRLDGPLDTFLARGGVAGAAAAVFDVDELAVSARGLTAHGPGGAPVRPDDQWHIGSCTKSMTAVLWARLVEAGRASWDVPVAELLGDVPDADPGWRGVTVDDLLRCRAGVRPNPPVRDMPRLWADDAPATEQRTAAVAGVVSSPPQRPGRFTYSNLSYVLVGAAVDRVAGMPYEEALRHHVLEPLGVTSAGFGAPPRVRGHRRRVQLGPLGVGGLVALDPTAARSDNPVLFTPAGRLHLDLTDWAAFVRTFLQGGPELVDRPSLDRLLAVPGDDPRSMAMGWADAEALGGSYVMQGSNTYWAATALLDRGRRHAALVAANDGRPSTVRNTALLARDLLAAQDDVTTG